MMTLVFLLCRRARCIVEVAEHTTLDWEELEIIQDSLETTRSAVWRRIDTLKGKSIDGIVLEIGLTKINGKLIAVCRLQNLNPDEQLRKFFYGMVRITHPRI